MNLASTLKLLKQHGMAHSEATDVAKQLAYREARRAAVVRARDWDYLLAPLLADIKTKGSTQSRWKDDPIREKTMTRYLALMRAVRDEIRNTQALNMTDKTIPEIALERNLSGRGMHWSDWVPRETHAKVMLAFEKMNNHPDRPRVGKRAVPFSTHAERSASDKRWDNLITQMLVEIEGRRGRDDKEARTQAPLIDALHDAVDIAYQRDLLAVAPVNWVHLLPKERQDALAQWRQETMNGMRDEATLSAASQELVARADAKVQARREKAQQRYAARKENT